MPAWGTLILFVIALAAFAGAVAGGLPAWLARLLDDASRFTAIFLELVIEALPFLLVGAIASAVLVVFIEGDELLHWLPRQPLPALIAGSLAGIFFPVGEAGVVLLVRRLIQKGAPVHVGVAMLLAAPVVNPVVIALSFAALGPGWLFWGRLGLTLLAAVLVGLAFYQTDAQSLLRVAKDESLSSNAARLIEVEQPFAVRFRLMALIALDEFFDMGRFLVIGALLAAFVQVVLPQAVLLAAARDPIGSVAALAGLAGLSSSGSTSDAFLSLAFVGLFPGGAILAFLVYGAMVDLKTVLMLTRVFKPRGVVYLVLLPLLITLILGFLINFAWPGWMG